MVAGSYAMAGITGVAINAKAAKPATAVASFFITNPSFLFINFLPCSNPLLSLIITPTLTQHSLNHG